MGPTTRTTGTTGGAKIGAWVAWTAVAGVVLGTVVGCATAQQRDAATGKTQSTVTHTTKASAAASASGEAASPAAHGGAQQVSDTQGAGSAGSGSGSSGSTWSGGSGGSGGSGSGHASPSSSPSASSNGYTTSTKPTLGDVWAPGVSGYGTVEPSEINNNGDPTGIVSGVSWSSWGGTTATGSGTSEYVAGGQSVADGTEASATVTAFDLGVCQGKLMYQAVEWYFPQYGQSFDPTSYINDCTGAYVGNG